MTDDKIIKALQCCSNNTTALTCYDCPLLDRGRPSCYFKNAKNALDLIKRQQEEIERLKTIVQIKNKKIDCLCEIIVSNRNQGIKEFVEKLKRINVDDRKYYVELDCIRLVYEDDQLVGWYRPGEAED